MNRTATQQSFSKSDVRQLIKFHVHLNMSPVKTHATLQEGLEGSCPSYETVQKWHKIFSGGSVNVEDAARSGCPSTATDDDHVTHVSVLLKEDRRLSCEELAQQVGISSSSVHLIFTEKLHKCKIAAKWISHLLTEEQLGNWTRICALHLQQF